MNHPFEEMAPDFRRRISAAVITRFAEHDKRARQLIKPAVVNRFKSASDELKIPPAWMICSFERESGCDFTRSPAQGDRWDRKSTHVPKGVGPFKSFEEAALWSYRHDGLSQSRFPWSLTYACWAWNAFNGFGPNNHGRVSGYVFAGTDQYDPPKGLGGKYTADSVWSGTAVDKQLGCLALYLRMADLAPELAFEADPVPVRAPPAGAPVPVLPIGIGGGSGRHPAAWIQDALNTLRVDGTPLVVDNSYGRRTRAAVTAFQRGHGLEVDGLAGPKTLAGLENALAGLAS